MYKSQVQEHIDAEDMKAPTPETAIRPIIATGLASRPCIIKIINPLWGGESVCANPSLHMSEKEIHR